jgi:hypothetical protein
VGGAVLEGLWPGKDHEEFAIKLSNIFLYLHSLNMFLDIKKH